MLFVVAKSMSKILVTVNIHNVEDKKNKKEKQILCLLYFCKEFPELKIPNSK